MRKIFLAVCLFSAYLTNAQAQSLAGGEIEVTDLNISKTDSVLYISMNVDPTNLKLKSNQEVILTPILIGEKDNQALPEITIAGRNRYYSHIRNSRMSQEQLKGLHKSKDKEVIKYQTSIAYAHWMDNSELVMEDSRCGCLSELLSKEEQALASLDFTPDVFEPAFVYMPPVITAQKNREVSGSAYIDYVVNQTTIREDYRNNRSELQKIFKSIDAVKNDPDATITRVEIKGYASPEGKYEGNARLAKGRTESLMRHVQQLYSFPSDIIRTDYEAEDWDGLRKYISESDISNKTGILSIIDGSLEPDPKEWKLKSTYPKEYKQLLDECYPGLRHSDYKVDYTVKPYTDVEEAKRVMQIRPGNLSLHEFYTVANSYEPGSAAYNEVFDIMARVYPDDETANLNAANVAMSRGDLSSAAKFLGKAGNSAKAEFARGNLAAIQKDYSRARQHFTEAKKGGIQEASAALVQLDKIEKKKSINI